MSQLWVWCSTAQWPYFSVIPQKSLLIHIHILVSTSSYPTVFSLSIAWSGSYLLLFGHSVLRFPNRNLLSKSVLRKKGEIEIPWPISNWQALCVFPQEQNLHISQPIEYVLLTYFLTLLMLLDSIGGPVLWTCLKLDTSIVTGYYWGLLLASQGMSF